MFTQEEIKMLAQVERDMDSGKRKFVIHNDQRCLITDECLEALGLEAGQTINDAIFMAMLEFNIKQCRAKLSDQILEQSDFDDDFIIDDQDFELTPEEEARTREEVLKNYHKVMAQKELENSIIADKSDSTVFEN